MAKDKIETLADTIINLTPQEAQKLQIVIKAKMMPEVEKELKEETPNAYPFMKGLSPITHMRKYLKEKK